MARASRAEWAKRIERWKDSGLTAKEFAAELGVTPSNLTFWKWKLRTESEHRGSSVVRANREQHPAPTDAAASFLQLVPTVAQSTDPLEVVFSNGVVLRVPQDFHEPTLLRLLKTLEGR